jgi:hypothetical protein
MKIETTINGIVFESKKTAYEYVRSIRDKHRPGQPLRGDDFAFVLSLLRGHPNYFEKAGVGIKDLYVHKGVGYKKANCFYLKRADDTSTDFSARKCIFSPKTTITKFKLTCRYSVDPYILAFKKSFFSQHKNPLCPISGESLTWRNSNIHHDDPWGFNKIVEHFIKEHNITPDDSMIKENKDLSMYEFREKRLRDTFVAFHKEKAILTVVKERPHLEEEHGHGKKHTS